MNEEIRLTTESETERAKYIRALYDAANQIASDQIDKNQSSEAALQNRQKLDALVAGANFVGSTEFGEATKTAVHYLTRLPLSSYRKSGGENEDDK